MAEDFAVLASENIAWSAVHDPKIPYDYPEGATSWLTPDEIRFFAAASLAERRPRRRGRLWIIGGPRAKELELDETKNGRVDPELLLDRSRSIAHELFEDDFEWGPAVRYESPEVIDRDYSSSTVELVRAIDPADPLLHRGLYKFLIATELIRFPQFLEEAALSAFISREAVLELLRRKLEDKTKTRLKREDVLNDIRVSFPSGDSLIRVLETDWSARIVMVHPVSKYGEYWSPPVHRGECWDALHKLTYLYRYFLLDEVWEPDEGD